MRYFSGIKALVLFASVALLVSIVFYAYRSNKSAERSFEELSASAQNGSARDQYNLGLLYSTGRGIPQDYPKAYQWYFKSANQGDAFGENGLGFLYFTGRGVPQDYVEALVWYRKAASQGNSKAQYNIGNMYRYGRGVEQNLVEANRWYIKAASQGHEDAQRMLGERWLGKDIASRIVLPLTSAITVLFLIGSILRGRGLHGLKYPSLTLTALIGIIYFACMGFWLPHSGVLLSLSADHILYFVMNLIIGMYLVQISFIVLPSNRRIRLAIVALKGTGAVLAAVNLYFGMHADLLSASPNLRLFCLSNGLLIGIIISLGLFLLEDYIQRRFAWAGGPGL